MEAQGDSKKGGEIDIEGGSEMTAKRRRDK